MKNALFIIVLILTSMGTFTACEDAQFEEIQESKKPGSEKAKDNDDEPEGGWPE